MGTPISDRRAGQRRSIGLGGVRARLLLAFFGIAAFAGLAAVAGIQAFDKVGGRLRDIDVRVPPVLSALELARSAERVVAAAPALLATIDRERRDEVKEKLAAAVENLNGIMRQLEAEQRRLQIQAVPIQVSAPTLGLTWTQSLQAIESSVTLLEASLVELDNLVERRLEISERIGASRREAFLVGDELQRLLAPWLVVMDAEVSALVDTVAQEDREGLGIATQRLASLVRRQRLTRTAREQAASVVDLLVETSTAGQAARTVVLDFELGLAFGALGETSADLDRRLKPLLLTEVARLKAIAQGPNAVGITRRLELSLEELSEVELSEAARLAETLTSAVERLGLTARQEVRTSIQDALQVQRLGARTLVALAALSLIASMLIVWLYVGGNIVRRLTALSDRMVAIADGSQRIPIEIRGTDEIAAMGRAVEVFRRNTLERDGLLAEKASAAEYLEKEVDRRTVELEVANRFKSRFLAAASHDLRQPLHALNLFVAQLGDNADPQERRRLAQRIDSAVASMNDLFEALLDMSKLDAGTLEPELTVFPVQQLLTRIENTFTEVARERSLRLDIVPSSASVRSDFILLERILLNLVSNAVSCTSTGGVVVGCRRSGTQLRIEVWDSGPGVKPGQRSAIFEEFHQIPVEGMDRSSGLGLGLAIVDRLARLLGHGVALRTSSARGSCFAITVPRIAHADRETDRPIAARIAFDPLPGKLIIVIDDDQRVLDGMGGVLRQWKCNVVTAHCATAALEQLAVLHSTPDLIIADYRLADGRTGMDAIMQVRKVSGHPIPAFLITGDTAPELLRDAIASGFQLLHKPVAPMRLRALMNQSIVGSLTGSAAAGP